MNNDLYSQAHEAGEFILNRSSGIPPIVVIVLGTGLGNVSELLSLETIIPYAEIPHFVPSTIDGHSGELLLGKCGDTPTAVMNGRVHFYEGYSMQELTFPIRAFSLMGSGSVILTNAAGSTSPHLSPGSLMLITDHINLLGDNPLRGMNDDRFGPRFPDMTKVYDPAYIDLAHEVAREIGIPLSEGVYAAVPGPNYETPAEVRMLRTLGADAIGMSTVPEAITARHSGMRVLGISCITNIAAGLSRHEISHSDVMEVGSRAAGSLTALISKVIPRLISE